MLKNRKILLVDDDEDDQEIFIDVLKEIEPTLQFAIARNGIEAIQKLSEELPLPVIILLDINMPKMNGLECLKVLKTEEKYKNIPVVMLTTSQDPPSVAQALKWGAKSFLTKAANMFDIRTQLHQVLTSNLVISF